MSYFFVTTLQVFFCIALLSGVLWSRNDPPSLRPLTWTLLTGLIAGVLAGLFIHGSQPVQLLLVGAEVMVSLLFVRHCCKVSDEAAFCLIQRPYISKTLLTRRISPRGSP